MSTLTWFICFLPLMIAACKLGWEHGKVDRIALKVSKDTMIIETDTMDEAEFLYNWLVQEGWYCFQPISIVWSKTKEKFVARFTMKKIPATTETDCEVINTTIK